MTSPFSDHLGQRGLEIRGWPRGCWSPRTFWNGLKSPLRQDCKDVKYVNNDRDTGQKFFRSEVWIVQDQRSIAWSVPTGWRMLTRLRWRCGRTGAELVQLTAENPWTCPICPFFPWNSRGRYWFPAEILRDCPLIQWKNVEHVRSLTMIRSCMRTISRRSPITTWRPGSGG